MKTVVVGDCKIENLFDQEDADAFTEADFEDHCIRALACVFPEYLCIRFEPNFRYEGRRFAPDLALISKSMSHWFVVEVELVSHSFDLHVLPQVKAFRYGDIDELAAAKAIERGTDISLSQAKTLVSHHPRFVVVVANRPQEKWEHVLLSHEIQFLSVAVYRNRLDHQIREVVGKLNAPMQVLAWGKYSLIDRSLRFPEKNQIPRAPLLQIRDPGGTLGNWLAIEAPGAFWLTKEVGTLNVADNETVQLIRDYEGRIFIRVPAGTR